MRRSSISRWKVSLSARLFASSSFVCCSKSIFCLWASRSNFSWSSWACWLCYSISSWVLAFSASISACFRSSSPANAWFCFCCFSRESFRYFLIFCLVSELVPLHQPTASALLPGSFRIDYHLPLSCRPRPEIHGKHPSTFVCDAAGCRACLAPCHRSPRCCRWESVY